MNCNSEKPKGIFCSILSAYVFEKNVTNVLYTFNKLEITIKKKRRI